MECLCVTYKKLFYKQAEMLCISFWTTSLMQWPRAIGTRKQYCIAEEQDKDTLSAASPGKPRTSKKKQSSEEDLRNLCVRCLEEPQGSTGKQEPKKSGELQTHRGPRGDWRSLLPFFIDLDVPLGLQRSQPACYWKPFLVFPSAEWTICDGQCRCYQGERERNSLHDADYSSQ